MIGSRILIAAGAAALLFTATAGSALADRRGYCDAYARDVAARKAGAGDVIAGTIGGAITGAIVGGLIDKGEGAGKGAIIGGAGGTLLGVGITSDSRRKAYRKAYARCMDQYEPEPVRARRAVDTDRLDYCASKYRSFNPRTGMYRTNSGKLRRCS
jgi:BA14K-like protein